MSDGIFTIGRDAVTKALNDPSFFSNFPMFKTMQNKANIMKSTTAAGCSTCRKKRIAQNLTSDFLSIVETLSKNDAIRLREYFGTEKMMYTIFDRQRGVYRTQVV